MKKLNAEETGLMLIAQGDKGKNYTFPNMPFRIIKKGREVELTFAGDFSEIGEKDLVEGIPCIFIADFTNDPTIKVAGGVVSLGYYLFRISLNNCEITSYKPLIIKAKREELKLNLNRSQRELYQPMPKGLVFNEEFSEDLELMKDYMVPNNMWGELVVVISLSDKKLKKYHTVIEYFDMRSFYAGPIIIDMFPAKNKEEMNKNHQEQFKKWHTHILQ